MGHSYAHTDAAESAVTVRVFSQRCYRRQHDLRLGYEDLASDWSSQGGGAGGGAQRAFYGVRPLPSLGRRPASEVQWATG